MRSGGGRPVVIPLALAIGWIATRGPLPHAPAIRVRLGPIISSDALTTDHAEPWLAVDARNPGRAIAASLTDSDGSVVYATKDAGKTWARARHDGPAEASFAGGDPVVVFDSDGNAYFGTISPFRVWRSRDGGTSWHGPVVVPGRSFDREYLAVREAKAAPDTLYAVGRTPMTVFGHQIDGGIGVSRSTDSGQTFDFPRLLLLDPARSIIHTPGSVVITPDGKILISVMAHDAPIRDLSLIENHVWILRSDDGGRTFGDPIPAATTVIHGNKGDPVKVAKSLATAGLAMDTAQGSPYRGRLYLGYLSVEDGRLQVMVAASSDTGRTWTRPVRVNDDGGTANHSNPVIAANAGSLVVLWNDRRADPNDLCFRATVAASIDGGASFLPNAPLVGVATCPLRGQPATSFGDWGFRERYLNGGETQGLAPLSGHAFLAVFVDGTGGTMQLRAATIEVAGAPARP